MNIDYYESAEGVTITRDDALLLLGKHGLPLEEYPLFYQDLGRKDFYEAQQVLNWLGY